METSSQSGSTRDVVLVGFVILLIGVAALISELLPDADRYLPLFVGLGLLFVFAISRSYLALIGGAVLTGLGTGLLVAGFFSSDAADGVGALLGLGAGFVSVWLVSGWLALKEHHWWPLVPGLILLAVGAGTAFDAAALPLALPVVLVAVGAALIVVAYLRQGRRPTSGSST
jgi:hypothetical protein